MICHHKQCCYHIIYHIIPLLTHKCHIGQLIIWNMNFGILLGNLNKYTPFLRISARSKYLKKIVENKLLITWVLSSTLFFLSIDQSPTTSCSLFSFVLAHFNSIIYKLSLLVKNIQNSFSSQLPNFLSLLHLFYFCPPKSTNQDLGMNLTSSQLNQSHKLKRFDPLNKEMNPNLFQVPSANKK